MISLRKVDIILLVICLYLVFINKYDNNKIDYNIDYIENNTINEYFETNDKSEIPNKIWTFWDKSEIPEFPQKCINSWKKYNPNYEIIILNKENIKEYLPDMDFNKLKHAVTPQRYSDYLRLCMLAKYGGIWMDASIICNQSFKWLHDIQNEKKVEVIAYYTASWNIGKLKDISPVIENWCFACIPNSKFISMWRDEFLKTNNYDNIDDYIRDVEKSGVNLQNIWDSLKNYLASHASAQVVLQNNKFNIHFIKSEDTAFKFLADFDECTRDITHGYSDVKCYWNVDKGVRALLDGKYKDQPLIKIRGIDRDHIVYHYKDYDKLFM